MMSTHGTGFLGPEGLCFHAEMVPEAFGGVTGFIGFLFSVGSTAIYYPNRSRQLWQHDGCFLDY
jgi:hypothetical protein